ncbi:MAG: hypothetical protein KC587_18030 [Nitrospira sp.]|nr:hypothetical protein [Nitrospira sp.]
MSANWLEKCTSATRYNFHTPLLLAPFHVRKPVFEVALLPCSFVFTGIPAADGGFGGWLGEVTGKRWVHKDQGFMRGAEVENQGLVAISGQGSDHLNQQ